MIKLEPRRLYTFMQMKLGAPEGTSAPVDRVRAIGCGASNFDCIRVTFYHTSDAGHTANAGCAVWLWSMRSAK